LLTSTGRSTRIRGARSSKQGYPGGAIRAGNRHDARPRRWHDTRVSTVEVSPRAPFVGRSAAWLRLARLARLLAWTSLAWLCVEGSVAVVAGIVAGSIALVGFGLDSAIEGLASFIVVWRFSGSRILSATSERRAQQLVAVSFFLLAPYVAVEALLALAVEHRAQTSWLGVGLSVGSLLICPGLGVAKRRIGTRLGSAATRGEGKQNLLCAGLAVGVLAGLLGNTFFGFWWLDPAVALVIAAAALQGGFEAWKGCGCDGCC
jgi:divalent metal cation (Fe/Co/Zn/Cd) transporter